jgi:hypothetical protein
MSAEDFKLNQVLSACQVRRRRRRRAHAYSSRKAKQSNNNVLGGRRELGSA